MESTKMMNNIKPAYAVKLGAGVFAGTTYIFQCKKCNLTIQNTNGAYPTGSCPKGGTHDWAKTTA